MSKLTPLIPLATALAVVASGAASEQPSFDLTATEATARMRAGEMSVLDYATDLLDRSETYGPTYNTFISLDRDRVLNAARALDDKRASGAALGPMFGVPIALKDLIATNGYPTSFGTSTFADFVPARNAVVVEQLLAADALIFGKANNQEMAFGSNGYNSHYGQQLNPYDPTLIAGGSSGGSAAAVSGRMVPVSLGSDTAASIRVPASFTGIYGLRPTTGRYDTNGIWPLAGTLDTVGPMARSVEDLALVDSVFTGDFTPLADLELSDIRLGVPAAFFQDWAGKEVSAAFQAYLAKLEGAGVTLVEADLPGAKDLTAASLYPILFFEVRPAIETYMGSWVPEADLDILYAGMGPDVKGFWDALIADGAPEKMPLEAYGPAVSQTRVQLQANYSAYFAANDLHAMIFPTAADNPPTGIPGNPMEQVIDGETVSTFVHDETSYPGAVAGVPGVSFPMAMSDAGLPIGVSLDGPRGQDRLVLAIARALSTLADEVPAPELQE